MTRFLVFALLLALVSYWLHRDLSEPPALPAPWSIIVDIFLGLLWVLAMIGVGSGELLDPSWARTPGFAGWVWLGTVFYLVLGLAIIGLASLSRGWFGAFGARGAGRSIRPVFARSGLPPWEW